MAARNDLERAKRANRGKTDESHAAAKELSASSIGKLPTEKFVALAITKLKTDQSEGIHVVYSGFSSALRQYYSLSKEESIATVDQLGAAGKIVLKPVRGGYMIYVKTPDLVVSLGKGGYNPDPARPWVYIRGGSNRGHDALKTMGL